MRFTVLFALFFIVANVTTANAAAKKKFKPIPISKYGYYNVLTTSDQKIAKIEFIRISDGRHMVEAFPHGYGLVRQATKKTRMTPNVFKAFMKVRAKKEKINNSLDGSRRKPSHGSSVAKQATVSGSSCSANASCSSGIPIGYNPSVGYVSTSTNCFNWQTTAGQGYTFQTNMQQVSGVTNSSSMINATASIFGAYDGITASDNFTYSSSYNTNSNSTQAFFSAYAYLPLANAIDQVNPLTSTGSSAMASGTFSSQCGSQYMTSVMAGMFVTTSFQSVSSNSTATTSINNSFKASYDVDQLSNAVSDANSTSQSTTSWNATFTVVGGGDTAANLYLNGGSYVTSTGTVAVAGVNTNQTIGYMQGCFAPISDSSAAAINTACGSFESNIASSGSGAISYFTYTYPATSLPQNLLSFTVFPSGVAGVQAVPSYASIPTANVSDIYSGWQSQIGNYLNVANQIQTLYNLANQYYTSMNGSTYDVSTFNLTGNLANLLGIYSSDVTAIKGVQGNQNLALCLGSTTTSSNISNNCSSASQLWAGNINSAYSFYSASPALSNSGSSNNDYYAAQNSIALLYSGYLQYDTGNNDGSVWGNGVTRASVSSMWLNQTPQGATGSYNGAGTMVNFVSSPWYYAGQSVTQETTPFMVWIPAVPPQTIPVETGIGTYSTITTATPNMTNIPLGFSNDYGFYMGANGANYITNTYYNPNSIQSQNGCTQSSSTPCNLGVYGTLNGGSLQNSTIGGTLNYNTSAFSPSLPTSGGN